MSSRRSSSSGDDGFSSRLGERTPLRSVENEVVHLGFPLSNIKSKSLFNSDLKTTKDGGAFCDPESHIYSPSKPLFRTPTNHTTVTEAGHGLGDLTLKSFICAGGEVEIFSSSVCAEESMILPMDQPASITCGAGDTVISDSMIVSSCSDHIEHPYYNAGMEDSSTGDSDAACHCENSSTALASEDLDIIKNDSHDDPLAEQNVTWKSFVCDGGEVEISDESRLKDETVPLPQSGQDEHQPDQSVDLSSLTDVPGHLSQEEHADHPYCITEISVSPVTANFTTLSETPQDKTPTGLSDITFKLFNCTGGEIEILDTTKHTDMTVPLPADQNATYNESDIPDVNPSFLAGDQDVQNRNDHSDHPYCASASTTSRGSLDVMYETEQNSFVHECQTDRDIGVAISTSTIAYVGTEQSNGNNLSEISPLPEGKREAYQPVDPLDSNAVSQGMTPEHTQDMCEKHNSVEIADAVVNEDPPTVTASLESLQNEFINCQDTPRKELMHPEDTTLPSLHQSFSAGMPTPVEVQQHVERSSTDVHPSGGPCVSVEAKDSALGSSSNGQGLCTSAEKPQAETLPDVLNVLSKCPSVVSALQFGLLSPAVRRASLAFLKAHGAPALDPFFIDDSALEGDKSMVAPVNVDPTGLLSEFMESSMPCPLFNSTAVGHTQPDPLTKPTDHLDVRSSAVPQSEVNKPSLDAPFIPGGPLQQQLRQMAEFLLLASGKMDPTAVSAPVPPPVATMVPSTRAESHNACVGTTPLKQDNHSVNTSGQFERKRDFTVEDECTLTDPLLWNVPPGSLECLPRQELEQRLHSSMIMVEVLVQQLAAARAHGCTPAGPAPSNLREKLVQTEHTELSQTTMYRDLYMEALNRIDDLEMDESSLQNLIHCMQDMKTTTTSLSSNTDAALCKMKLIEDTVRDDHQSLVSHYQQMKSLFAKSKETHVRMVQKVKDALQQRDNMQIQMEEAFTAKEAAFSAMDQLRTHCATEISELERSVGSQQQLLSALHQTYPEQVALNKAYSETLNSASELLSKTTEEQSRLMTDLCTVRGLVQKTAPLLLTLNEKAAAALRERDEHIAALDQAVEERQQIEEEFNQANLDLQAAREQIGDLNLQVTILTSEMGVLRQKLTEGEEERAQLERQVTELSATVSSTLASYTFLEQALAAETTKLQQSWKDIQQAKDRADELETSLSQSQQRVCELSQALAHSEQQMDQLQTLSQSQTTQIQQLQEVCTQLSGVREMNEFLQMENELAREQVAESESVLRANLQGLRERNIQCEDLKGELSQLQLENKSLQEELEIMRSKVSATESEHGENMAQAVTEITLLHHTLRGLTNDLHARLNEKKQDKPKDPGQLVHNTERRHPSSSFVDSVMVALTAEKEEDVKTEASVPVQSDPPEPVCETLFSETSAFTRVATIAAKKTLNATEFEPEEQSSVAELLVDLGSTVTELASTLMSAQQHEDAQLEDLHTTICNLQREQQAAEGRYQTEVFELKHQLSRLNSLVERGNLALQQKAQDEKTVTKLVTEMSEIQEILNKYKTDNNELRKEALELRRALQQSQVESHFLREELKKAGGQSAKPAHFMEEKIELLKEVERLKMSLQEAEQARVKLLERAKRHQIIHQTNQQKSEKELHMLSKVINKVRETLLSLPEVVKHCEQLQQLVEYIG
ncbi:sperm-associated antigen 5 [Sphaeramia orbicularis]|uniref:sperm-associated antigen 5 n=1 Tax=Sphaeramia orbicularis TaxID=375764 RepID=UPI00117C5784|nr:sperm-associated antigen 5 [Sphaeramia orbicularis]